MIPLYLFPSYRILATGGVAVVSIVLAGLFLYEVHAQPLAQQSTVSAEGSAPSGTVYLSPSAHAAAEASSGAKAPMLEMHIANNGLVLLRGAHVLSISGTTIRVALAWGENNLTWNVNTEYNTQFLTTAGEKRVLADIRIGDIVTVTGMLVSGGTEPTVNAAFVRG